MISSIEVEGITVPMAVPFAAFSLMARGPEKDRPARRSVGNGDGQGGEAACPCRIGDLIGEEFGDRIAHRAQALDYGIAIVDQEV